MRCQTAIAVFLLVVALPLAAQHGGGGHASGGGGHSGGFASHGSFSGHAGGFSGSHSSSGARSFAPRSYNRGAYNRGYSRGPIARGYNRGTNLRIRTYGLGNNCYAGRCGYGYGSGYPYLWGGVDPYWWSDNGSDNGYDPSQAYNYDSGLADQMYQQGVPMRPAPEVGPGQSQSNDQGNENYSAQSAQPHQPERTELSTSTVIVFRDQHREEVGNYAIVGETLWTFAPQKTQKISLDDIDIPATQKANEAHGVDFRIPGA
jgi:hypothetical protein